MNSRIPITILEAKPEQEATNAGVRQDKYPPADNRPKHHGSETRQTAQIAGRAPFPTKAKIASIAKAQGLTESKVVVDLVHKALQMDADVQYGALLRPVIQDQIHKDIQSYSNRTANINFQALYAAEQTRLLSIHILRFLTDLVDSPDELVPIITASQQNAWENITKMFSDMPSAPPRREENDREWPS